MGIFSRTRDIIAANVTDLLDRAEDPEKMIRQIIFEMNETLVEVRASAARTIADQKEMRRHIAKLESLQDKVAVVLLEATGGSEQPAAAALCASGFAVMVVSPRQARDFAKAMGYLAKTDSTDARALSHFARTLHTSEKRERLLTSCPRLSRSCCGRW